MNAESNTHLEAPRDLSQLGRGRRLMAAMLPALLVAYVAVPLVAARN